MYVYMYIYIYIYICVCVCVCCRKEAYLSKFNMCSRLRLDEPTAAQVVNKFPSFYEVRMLNNVFTMILRLAFILKQTNK